MDPRPTTFRAPAKTTAPKARFVDTARGKAAAPSPLPSHGRAARWAPSGAASPWPQKHSMLPHPPRWKPLKVSPPIPAKAARPSRPVPVVKPLKKACPATVDLAAPVKPSAENSAGRTPMVPVKAPAEDLFFTAQDWSSHTLNSLERASYWLAQIHLSESAGKHSVSAKFFGLAFECQAQPIHRIRTELRNYVVRYENASTLTPLFRELLVAHAMPVNQLKFDTDGSEQVDTPTTTNTVD